MPRHSTYPLDASLLARCRHDLTVSAAANCLPCYHFCKLVTLFVAFLQNFAIAFDEVLFRAFLRLRLPTDFGGRSVAVGLSECGEMAKGEDQSLFKDSPSTDDLHSEDGAGMCWFPPRGRGRWRFARLEGKQSRWRVSSLTRSRSTVGRDDSASCCCCGPQRWGRNSKRGDGDGNAGAAREDRGRSSTKGNLLRKFASFNDSSSLRYADGGRVSPALSPLPVRTMSKMERDREREASVPIWQRRASMSPIKALDLRHRAS